MRVLIASKHVAIGTRPIGGVQTWGRTVGDELRRLGHSVEYWEPGLREPEGRFDLGVFSNLKWTGVHSGLCDKVVKFTHGIIPDEQGGRDFIATSEEVALKWGCDRILRQPIDLSFWKPDDIESRSPVLTWHSYRPAPCFIQDIANEFQLSFDATGRADRLEVRRTLQSSLIVVATGRALLEAMACGASVIVADNREYQGPLIDLDVFGSSKRNYSGRGGHELTADTFADALDKALLRQCTKAESVAWLRWHHDSKKIVQDLLQC